MIFVSYTEILTIKVSVYLCYMLTFTPNKFS